MLICRLLNEAELFPANLIVLKKGYYYFPNHTGAITSGKNGKVESFESFESWSLGPQTSVL